jgi:hypothetical protein
VARTVRHRRAVPTYLLRHCHDAAAVEVQRARSPELTEQPRAVMRICALAPTLLLAEPSHVASVRGERGRLRHDRCLPGTYHTTCRKSRCAKKPAPSRRPHPNPVPAKSTPVRATSRAGRNDLCQCGSGKKCKNCRENWGGTPGDTGDGDGFLRSPPCSPEGAAHRLTGALRKLVSEISHQLCVERDQLHQQRRA